MRYKLETNHGDIIVELDADKAPVSAENFAQYADEGHYNGVIFHRVIPDFMIQTGAFTPDMEQKSGRAPIANEWQNGLSNMRGTLAMARLGNQPDSATNQFFINLQDNDFLDQPRDGAGYAVFGKVVEGLEVIDSIAKVKTADKRGHGDVPVEPVVINAVSRADA